MHLEKRTDDNHETGSDNINPHNRQRQKTVRNLRPITLLNTDYKIFIDSIALRLKSEISDIISETQSGFLRGRLIHNNIRLFLDLLDYTDYIDNQGSILSRLLQGLRLGGAPLYS